ncbi:MAG: cytidylate kinase [Spirochaetae bacterium HGW-Spirochaetae-1]|jgi:cytidylate kinase|nr:MAG: cytidylate kinase [Spirochaetae bacterium HGW-Spirochaetae-1]
MNTGKRIIAAIDGPAGSGKSSVSKEAALALGMKYIDSGAIYRSVTWFFLQTHESLSEGMDFEKGLHGLIIEQKFNRDGSSCTYVNSADVSELIRNEVIAGNIGIVSDNRAVREFVNGLLRKWSEKDSIIMDGRDIGTIVFPDADVKIYLDASVDIRAERRIKEYREMGKNVDENSIKTQIIQRDEQDRSREFGALKQADDAIYCDTSSMSKKQVIEFIVKTIKGKLEF